MESGAISRCCVSCRLAAEVNVKEFSKRYTLQGIPLGLGQVFPMILKDRGASMTELGLFSLHLVTDVGMTSSTD